MKPTVSGILPLALLVLVSCSKDDTNDDTADGPTSPPIETDSGEEDTDTEDTDTDTEPVYDASLSVQENLDNGVGVLLILEHHPVSELYGLSHEGGYIFYVDETTGGGMVAHSLADSGPTHWNDFSNSAPDLSLGSAIGDGEPNTVAIVGALGEDVYAARYAFDADFNGFDDWFLPSIDELTAVYTNLHLNGLGDADAGLSYWSSTDEGVQGAWVIYFANGNTYTPNKTHDHHNVLPVRSF